MLILSRPSGAIAQRIGPRIPLAFGAVLTGAGLLLMAQIHVGDGYLTGVLPSLVVFGAGLAALITPITATVLASVGSQHSGIASAFTSRSTSRSSFCSPAISTRKFRRRSPIRKRWLARSTT